MPSSSPDEPLEYRFLVNIGPSLYGRRWKQWCFHSIWRSEWPVQDCSDSSFLKSPHSRVHLLLDDTLPELEIIMLNFSSNYSPILIIYQRRQRIYLQVVYLNVDFCCLGSHACGYRGVYVQLGYSECNLSGQPKFTKETFLASLYIHPTFVSSPQPILSYLSLPCRIFVQKDGLGTDVALSTWASASIPFQCRINTSCNRHPELS